MKYKFHLQLFYTNITCFLSLYCSAIGTHSHPQQLHFRFFLPRHLFHSERTHTQKNATYIILKSKKRHIQIKKSCCYLSFHMPDPRFSADMLCMFQIEATDGVFRMQQISCTCRKTKILFMYF